MIYKLINSITIISTGIYCLFAMDVPVNTASSKNISNWVLVHKKI